MSDPLAIATPRPLAPVALGRESLPPKPPPSRVGRGRLSRCPTCGYLRHGLSDAALCPECGWDPAEPAPALRAGSGEAAWARTVLTGIALLLSASVTLLGVTLVMRFRDQWGGSLPVINFPGPKVWAAVLVQRTVGNAPGYWGVTGTVTALYSLVAVWLLTHPRPADLADEAVFSLRRLCRWGTLVAFGAAFGMLLSEGQVAWWGNDERELYFLLLISTVELPAATLLYLHLRSIAGRVGDRAAWRGLSWVALGAPLIIGGAVVMLLVGDAWMGQKQAVPQQMMVATYGAAALVLAVVATVSIARLSLTLTLIGLGSDDIGTGVAGVGRRLLATARRVLLSLLGNWNRIALVGGLLIWVSLCILYAGSTAMLPKRASVLGDLPIFNFWGPKIAADFVASNGLWWSAGGNRLTDVTAILLLLVAVWGMTVGGYAGEKLWSLRRMARWWPTLAAGAALGVSLAHGHFYNDSRVDLSQQTKMILAVILLLDLPATLLVFLHLASRARSADHAGLGRSLVWSGIFASALMLVAVWLLLMTTTSDRAWLGWRGSLSWYAAAAIYGAATAAASVFAAWQVLRLAAAMVLDKIPTSRTADSSR